MTDALDHVLACVEARREDVVELLQELVRVNSVNPEFAGVRREDVIGGETRANEILRERYEQAGLETHWVAPDPERRNLVGKRKGRNGGGRSLALNGHVDTVPPVDPDNWVNGNPWNPEIRDERLYGIGSTDMKASDAAMWLVAQALTDAGIELEGDLLLHSVVGEETMQHELGTSAVLEAGFTADAAIVTEPTSMPGLSQKVWSSVAITASITNGGTSANMTGSRSSRPRTPIRDPSLAYTVVRCESSLRSPLSSSAVKW